MNVEKILSALVKFSPMSLYEDLGITSDILNFTQPKVIVELGAGGGGWAAFMCNILQHKFKYVGYENFILNYGLKWSTNEKDLIEYLETNSSGNDIIIKNKDVKQISMDDFKNLKIDVVRLDCLEDRNQINNLFYKIYPYTSDKCIFLVDDIVPNVCPNRFLSYMDKVFEGILKPVWFGAKEGAWCKNTYDSAPLQGHILKEMSDKVIGKNENIFWYNSEYRIILSRGGMKQSLI